MGTLIGIASIRPPSLLLLRLLDLSIILMKIFEPNILQSDQEQMYGGYARRLNWGGKEISS